MKRVGFSFHDTPETLEKILSAHPEMEFVQLQINYADWESERVQSRRCYETARRHGKDVIIMEPGARRFPGAAPAFPCSPV